MRDAFLNDDRAQSPADPQKDLAARASSLVAAIYLLLPRMAFPAIRLITLIWVLILGQAMASESQPLRNETCRSDGLVGVAKVGQSTPSSPVSRLAKIRPCHRTGITPHLLLKPRSNDPNDDSTSDDPTDDDDNWEDVNADDNSEEVVIDWFPSIARYLNIREILSVPLRTETPSTPFLLPQRLRC